MAGGTGGGWEAPPRWAWVVMVVGVVALLVLTPMAARRGGGAAADTSRTAAPATTSAAPTTPAEPEDGGGVQVAVLGGSYVAGDGTSTPWPELLATQQSWEVTAFAAEGGGFVAEVQPGTTIGTRVDAVVEAAPDVVVVVGGRDDIRQEPGVVQPAAREVVTRLREGLPDATVLVVGALWSGDPLGFLTTIDNALRGVATELRVPFADARGEAWLDGGDEPLTTPDGAQLTEAGNRVVAERVGAALLAAGVPAGASAG